jgi:hypothetical protein
MIFKKENFHIISLWSLVFFCFISICIALCVSLVFSDNLERKNFDIEALVIPQISNTNENIDFIPLKTDATSIEEARMFQQNFIKEYIVNRYTVINSSSLMNQNLALNDLSSPPVSKNGYLLKKPSYISKDNWYDAYLNFINGKDGELQEIQDLMKSNTTRSVRILSEPVREGDWWITNVEFIYKSPITYSFANTKKEKYEIKMNIESRGIVNISSVASYVPPSGIFKIFVKYIQKTRL